MGTIDENLLFSSDWDIDQILLPDPIIQTISIAASPDGGTSAATATLTYSHGLGYLPVTECEFQAQGQTTWHQCGLPDGFILANWDTTGGGGIVFWPGMIATNGATVAYGFDTTSIYFTALNYNTISQLLTIRIHLWGDHIDYD